MKLHHVYFQIDEFSFELKHWVKIRIDKKSIFSRSWLDISVILLTKEIISMLAFIYWFRDKNNLSESLLTLSFVITNITFSPRFLLSFKSFLYQVYNCFSCVLRSALTSSYYIKCVIISSLFFSLFSLLWRSLLLCSRPPFTTSIIPDWPTSIWSTQVTNKTKKSKTFSLRN